MKNSWTRIKEDPFFRVSISWALGITGMIMVVSWAELQLGSETFDRAVFELVPFLFVLFGAAYMVKFVGRKPALYTALCGVFVAIFMALIGLIGDLMNGLSWEAFARFVWVAAFRSVGMALMGWLGGYIMTRGRVPIEIEMPGKKEIEAAHKAGIEEPTPRIVTPVSAMPGSFSLNASLLEQLENNPESLLPEKEKRRREKKQV